MSNEKDRFGNPEQGYDGESLKELAAERHEQLAAERERSAGEQSREHDVEGTKREALEHASKAEKATASTEKSRHEAPAERRGPMSKREREASYQATMKEVRSQMSGPSRAFSSVIHNPVVEKVSDAVGGTVARPNAILAGAVFAFLFTLVIYLVARFNGYPLSGSESIASFTLGWLVGLVFDYLRLLVLGKK